LKHQLSFNNTYNTLHRLNFQMEKINTNKKKFKFKTQKLKTCEFAPWNIWIETIMTNLIGHYQNIRVETCG
jgi:hypothetical protein